MPIGDMDIIGTAPRERFVEFYRQYYRPSRTTVFAVGDFDVDAMEAKIKAQFADWQPKEPDGPEPDLGNIRSEEHTSELQSLMRISYAVFCLQKKNNKQYTKIRNKINNTT